MISEPDLMVLSSDAVSAMIDGEVVALNAARGTCYGLNSVGSRIWQLLGAPISKADICAVLTREFDVDQATCDEQVGDLIEELIAAELAIVQGRGPPVPR